MLEQVLQRYARLKSFKAETFETLAGSPRDIKVFDRARKTRFYHSGDFGDIIYALPTIRALGGGDLVIGPEIDIGLNVKTRLKFTQALVERIAPLLRFQPYIGKVEYSSIFPPDIDCDLNQFRHSFMEDKRPRRRGKRQMNLAELHLFMFEQALDECNRAWLVVDRVTKLEGRPVLLHRSARWRNEVFPWDQVLAQHGHHAAFVGLAEEYRDFTAKWSCSIPHVPTSNFLELARLIAGSELYIGNQSAPYAVAEGLKKNTLQEVWLEGPNCLFERDNAYYVDGKHIFIPSCMKTLTHEIAKCPLCGNGQHEQVRTVADIVECMACDLVYLRTRPTKEALEQRYQSYADGLSHMHLPETISEITASGLRRDSFINEVLKQMVAQGGVKGSLLDVGCGWGAFIGRARECGFDVSGVEICVKMANFASTILGLPIQTKQLEDCTFKDGSFQVVTMLHVLENLPNTKTALQTVHRLLEPGGLFCGLLSNFGSLCSLALRDKWPWLDPELKYVHFTPASLTYWLTEHRFQIVKLYTQTGDYSTADVVSEIKAGSNVPMPAEAIAACIEEQGKGGRGEEIVFFARKIT